MVTAHITSVPQSFPAVSGRCVHHNTETIAAYLLRLKPEIILV